MDKQLVGRRRLAAAAAAVALAGLGVSESQATLTLDLRATDGSKAASVSAAGTVTLDVFAQISGVTDATKSGIQNVYSSFLSSNGGLLGNLSGLTLTSPFNANGSSTGAAVDLDTDTDADVGSNTNSDATGFWN